MHPLSLGTGQGPSEPARNLAPDSALNGQLRSQQGTSLTAAAVQAARAPLSGTSNKLLYMMAWAMPCFSFEGLLFTPAMAPGTTVFLPIHAHSAKGLCCVSSQDLQQTPIPLAGSPDERGTITMACGIVQSALLPVAQLRMQPGRLSGEGRKR